MHYFPYVGKDQNEHNALVKMAGLKSVYAILENQEAKRLMHSRSLSAVSYAAYIVQNWCGRNNSWPLLWP